MPKFHRFAKFHPFLRLALGSINATGADIAGEGCFRIASGLFVERVLYRSPSRLRHWQFELGHQKLGLLGYWTGGRIGSARTRKRGHLRRPGRRQRPMGSICRRSREFDCLFKHNQFGTSPFFPATDRFHVEVRTLGAAVARSALRERGRSIGSLTSRAARGCEIRGGVKDPFSNIAGVCGPVFGSPCHAGGTQWHLGWTAGAGLEIAFSKNLSAAFDYSYVDLGSRNYNNPTAPLPVGTLAFNGDLDTKLHLLTLRLNYKFNWAQPRTDLIGPAIGRYAIEWLHL